MSKKIPALAPPDQFIFGKKTLGKFFPLPAWRRWHTIGKAAFGLPLTDEEASVLPGGYRSNGCPNEARE